MTATRPTVQTQVRIKWEPDQQWHIYESPSWVRLAIADTKQAAEEEAKRKGWEIKGRAPRLADD
jgi:hypothetical protein